MTKLSVFLMTMGIISTITASSAAGNKADADVLYEEGVEFLKKAQYIRASAKLEKAYSLNPDWKYLEAIGNAQLGEEKNEAALKSFKTFLKKGGRKIPKSRRETVQKKVDQLERQKKRDANFDKAKAHYDKGVALYNQKNYEKAIIQFEAAYELYDEYIVVKKIADTELALGNKSRALEAYKKYLVDGGNRIDGKTRKSVERTVTNLEKEFTHHQNQKEAAALFKKGQAHVKGKEYDQAIDALSSAYQKYPYTESLYLLGQAETGRANYAAAINNYNNYLKKIGKNITPEKRNAVKKEIARLNALAQKDADQEKAAQHMERGDSYAAAGKYSKAFNEYKRAYALNGDYRVIKSIALTYEKQGRLADAIDAYKKYLSRGEINITTTEQEEMEAHIAKLEEQLQAAQIQKKAMGRFKAGLGYFEKAEFEKASIEFEHAYINDPDYKILGWQAATEAKLKHYEKAIELYRSYLEEGGTSITAERRVKTEQQIEKLENLVAKAKAPAPPVQPEVNSPEPETKQQSPEPSANVLQKQQEQEAPQYTPPPPKKERKSFDPDPGKRVWTWVAAGLSGVGIGGAITCGIIAKKEQDKIDSVCPDGVCPPEYIDGAQDRQNTVKTLTTLRNVSIGVAAGSLAAGIALYFLEPEYIPNPKVSLTPSVDKNAAGLILTGRF